MNDPQVLDAGNELARRVAAAMFANDTASKALGMRIEEMRPGYARLSMIVRADMLNGLGSCHGGMMFALADSAFAFACNSHNEATVAAGCSIEFLQPVPPGAVLTAIAQERARVGRRGVYPDTLGSAAGGGHHAPSPAGEQRGSPLGNQLAHALGHLGNACAALFSAADANDHIRSAFSS